MIQPRPHLLKIRRDREWDIQRNGAVRLDGDEQIAPWSEAMHREILATLPADIFNRYPDSRPLYERLGEALEVGIDSLFVTAGSDAAIRSIFETFIEPGDTVVFADPTCPLYLANSQLYQARALQIPHGASRELLLSQVLAALKRRPRLLAIVNPSQPMGTAFSVDALRAVGAAAECAGTILLIDEACYPFCPETAIDWSPYSTNVIVTRTFSNAGGMAGVGLGYLVANPRLIDFIGRTRGCHEVNSIAVAVGCYLLDHAGLAESRLREIESGRDILLRGARKLGLEAPSCQGNFQLLRVPAPGDTGPWLAALKADGYLVKGGFTAPAIRDCLRVTLAGPEIMTGFTAALEAAVEESERGLDLPLSQSLTAVA
jgi:histidinol-phosphate aminotransferase